MTQPVILDGSETVPVPEISQALERSVKPFSLVATAMSIEEAKTQHHLIRRLVSEILIDGIDYGVIPGAGDKKVLFKTGAEHMCQFFRLRPSFEIVSMVESHETGLAFYRYRCDLVHVPSNLVVGCGIGSASTYEAKYRYRTAKRVCPECGHALSKSKFPDKKTGDIGWYCYAKTGGCGANFLSTDAAVMGQELGQVENENLHDLWNTVDKMAQKRSLIAATLITIGGSGDFTQDVEDNVDAQTPPVKPVPSTGKTAEIAPPTRETQGGPHSIQEFRGKVFAILSKALAAKIPDMTVGRIVSLAFDDPKMTPQDIHAVNDMKRLVKAYEAIENMLKVDAHG